MRRKMLMKLLSLGLLAGLGMSTLTGCQEEKEVDYSIEGVTEEEQTTDTSAQSGVAQFQDITEWQAEWSASNEGAVWGPSTVDIVVDAKITVPETEQMSVFEVAETEFNEEYKEQMANHLFESEDIYYGDISHLTKKELDGLQDFFESEGAVAVPGVYFQNKEEFQKDLTEYETALENPKDSYTLVDGYTENEYIGTYEGIQYNLSFREFLEEDVLRKKEIVFEPYTIKDVCPEAMQGEEEITYSPWTQDKILENQAEISEEEAIKKAQDFVDNLGVNYAVRSASCPLVWKGADNSEESADDEIANGYVISFDFGIDDISFLEYGTEEHYVNLWALDYANYLLSGQNDKTSLYSMKTQMQVYVTDKGIIKMSASNPLETVGVSERVELLPLDTIQDIIQKELETNYGGLHMMTLTSTAWFDRMDLIYFRVCDKENPEQYSYVPVWRLAYITMQDESQPLTIRDSILINAIDGSVIDLFTDL